MSKRDSEHRALEHDALYDGQLAKIGDIKRIDEVIRCVHGAIATNPEAFPIVPGTERLRVAKTRRFAWDEGVLPHLVIWFSIKDENTVRLRAVDIECEPAEDEWDGE